MLQLIDLLVVARVFPHKNRVIPPQKQGHTPTKTGSFGLGTPTRIGLLPHMVKKLWGNAR